MMTGAPWNGAVNVYYHSTGDAEAVYKGALVVPDNLHAHAVGGYVGSAGTVYPACTPAADGDTDIIGVAWTFGTTPQVAAQVNNLNAVNYCPASTGMYIGVIDDPNVIFSIQDSSVLAATDINLNFDTTANKSGSTVTGRSSAELASSGYAATAQLQLLRMIPRADNSLLVNADWEVRLNETRFTHGGANASTT
jgi:hypothetical protein